MYYSCNTLSILFANKEKDAIHRKTFRTSQIYKVVRFFEFCNKRNCISEARLKGVCCLSKKKKKKKPAKLANLSRKKFLHGLTSNIPHCTILQNCFPLKLSGPISNAVTINVGKIIIKH